MVEDRFAFATYKKLKIDTELYFNVLLCGLPVFVIFWLPGIWISLAVIVVMYNLFMAKNSYRTAVRQYWSVDSCRYMVCAYVLYLVFSVSSVLFLGSSLQSIDNAGIFLIWLAVSPVLSLFKPNSAALGYGCLIAVCGAFLMAIYQFHFLGIGRPYGRYGAGFPGTGAIKFGDISVLMGILAYFLVPAHKMRLLAILGAGLGLIVCLYTGARGGLLAVLLCVLLGFFLFKPKIAKKQMLVAVALSVIGLLLLNTLMTNHILSRVSATMAQLSSVYEQGFSLTGSIGNRFLMWQAAFILFENHPILGVGLNNFDDALLGLYKQHIMPRSVLAYSHAHNEYLCALATGGIVGFSITLSLFLLPIQYFKTTYFDSVWGKAGFWGVCLIAFFALTDCMFDRRMTILAFIGVISVCMAGSFSQKTSRSVSHIAPLP